VLEDQRDLWRRSAAQDLAAEQTVGLALELLNMESKALAEQSRQQLKRSILKVKGEESKKLLIDQYILVTELNELVFNPPKSRQRFDKTVEVKLKELKRLGIRMEFVEGIDDAPAPKKSGKSSKPEAPKKAVSSF
jgi:hypothetical protein